MHASARAENGSTRGVYCRVSIALLCLLALVSILLPSGKSVRAQAVAIGSDADVRPDPKGTATKVLVSLFVIDIREIDEAKQHMTVDLVIRMQWKDPRLALQSQDESARARRMALDEVWNPQIFATKPQGLTRVGPNRVRVDPDGTVTYRQRFLGNLGVNLDLKEFPLDQNALSIHLVSFDHTPDRVEIVLDDERTGRADAFSIEGWDIGEISAERALSSVSPNHRNLAAVHYTLPAKRQVGFYLWKVIVPLTLIVFMSWAVFFIEPAHLGVQIAIATSSVLTLIAFYLHLGTLLPQISFLTRLDFFILGATILVFLAFGEAIVTSLQTRYDRHEEALRLDRLCRLVFPLGFLGLVAYSFWL